MPKLKLKCGALTLPLLFVVSIIMVNSGYAMSAKKNEMKISDSNIIERSLVSCGDTSRLERVFLKAKIKGEKIVVATLGGSITEGALATKPENRYASIVAQWFKDKFCADNVEFINAGHGII